MPRKRLSVLLCNYNHARYLRRAIWSAALQSRRPDQLILLDDASTDGSFAIMEEFAERFPFVQAVRNATNMGNTASMNRLMDLADGDYIHRAAADDYMLPGFVRRLMRLAERHDGAGIVCGAIAPISEELDANWFLDGAAWKNPSSGFYGMDLKTGFYSPGQFRDYLKTADPTGTVAPATLFRRDLVYAFGGWRQDLGIWDVSFVLQAAALTHGAAYYSKPVYTWVARERGWTYTEMAEREKIEGVFRRYYAAMTSPPFDTIFPRDFAERWLEKNQSSLPRRSV